MLANMFRKTKNLEESWFVYNQFASSLCKALLFLSWMAKKKHLMKLFTPCTRESNSIDWGRNIQHRDSTRDYHVCEIILDKSFMFSSPYLASWELSVTSKLFKVTLPLNTEKKRKRRKLIAQKCAESMTQIPLLVSTKLKNDMTDSGALR